ncbi:hypothetical protein BV25DRAFT_1824048 [Artomyces pyxidatus]|uniref:Uncharacterized protein n=1 Tax=Artomyces pyxidatus TaxID=48021 RepID=A0ACB8T6G0_9AGAM|nr:hypothetical protein BV25DRAFT_1824048 [Artomyces pyxidatus]
MQPHTPPRNRSSQHPPLGSPFNPAPAGAGIFHSHGVQGPAIVGPDPEQQPLPMNLELNTVLSTLRNETREAPWYGPWTIVLKEKIFKGMYTGHALSSTYPQYSLVRTFDVYRPEDDDASDTDSDEGGPHPRRRGDVIGDQPVTPMITDDEDQAEKVTQTAFGRIAQTPSPETPSITRPRGGRAVTPSPPKSSKYFDQMLIVTPPNIRKAEKEHKKKSSTRIPDFVQILHQLDRRNGREMDPPEGLKSRVILLVEVKPTAYFPADSVFVAAFTQTKEQARHAFAEDPNLSRVGVLLCVGRTWSYVEHTRQGLTPSPTQSERDDPSYEPSPKPPAGRRDRKTTQQRIVGAIAAIPEPFLEEIFRRDRWLYLQDAEGRSEKAFRLIMERLRTAHSDMLEPGVEFD